MKYKIDQDSLTLPVAPVYAMTVYTGVKWYLQSFLFLDLDRDELSASGPVRFTSEERLLATLK